MICELVSCVHAERSVVFSCRNRKVRRQFLINQSKVPAAHWGELVISKIIKTSVEIEAVMFVNRGGAAWWRHGASQSVYPAISSSTCTAVVARTSPARSQNVLNGFCSSIQRFDGRRRIMTCESMSSGT